MAVAIHLCHAPCFYPSPMFQRLGQAGRIDIPQTGLPFPASLGPQPTMPCIRAAGQARAEANRPKTWPGEAPSYQACGFMLAPLLFHVNSKNSFCGSLCLGQNPTSAEAPVSHPAEMRNDHGQQLGLAHGMHHTAIYLVKVVSAVVRHVAIAASAAQATGPPCPVDARAPAHLRCPHSIRESLNTFHSLFPDGNAHVKTWIYVGGRYLLQRKGGDKASSEKPGVTGLNSFEVQGVSCLDPCLVPANDPGPSFLGCILGTALRVD